MYIYVSIIKYNNITTCDNSYNALNKRVSRNGVYNARHYLLKQYLNYIYNLCNEFLEKSYY